MNHQFVTPLLAAVMAAGVAGSASAATIYQQTFDTDTSDMLGTYGFSQTGLAGTATVSGGVAQIGTDNDWTVYATTQTGGYTYDWSQPLTLSASVGWDTNAPGVTMSIFLATGTGAPGSDGILLGYYQGYQNGNPLKVGNVSYGLRYDVEQTTQMPTITGMYDLAMTIRQNADSNLFDIKVAVDGVDQTTTNDGWMLGYSKSAFGIAGSPTFGTIGMKAFDGFGTQRLDNLTLSVIPEPSSAILLGAAGFAGLVRRRRHS